MVIEVSITPSKNKKMVRLDTGIYILSKLSDNFTNYITLIKKCQVCFVLLISCLLSLVSYSASAQTDEEKIAALQQQNHGRRQDSSSE